MQRKHRALGPGRLHLDAPVVRGHSGHFPLAEPLGALQGQARVRRHPLRRPALDDRFPPPSGPEQKHVAGAGRDALLRLGPLQLGDADRLIVGADPLHPAQARDVEQDPAADRAGQRLVDAVAAGAAQGRDGAGRRHVVVELVVVPDVREAVPLRCALQGQGQHVISDDDVFRRGEFAWHNRHRMDRIESPPGALLGPVTPEREAQLENLARANGRRGPQNVLWRNKFQGTALVIGTPAAPVRELLSEFLEIAHDMRLSSTTACR